MYQYTKLIKTCMSACVLAVSATHSARACDSFCRLMMEQSHCTGTGGTHTGLTCDRSGGGNNNGGGGVADAAVLLGLGLAVYAYFNKDGFKKWRKFEPTPDVKSDLVYLDAGYKSFGPPVDRFQDAYNGLRSSSIIKTYVAKNKKSAEVMRLLLTDQIIQLVHKFKTSDNRGDRRYFHLRHDGYYTDLWKGRYISYGSNPPKLIAELTDDQISFFNQKNKNLRKRWSVEYIGDEANLCLETQALTAVSYTHLTLPTIYSV